MADKAGVEVRLARPEDAPGICRLHKRSIRHLCSSHYTVSEIEQWQGRQREEKYLRFIERAELFVCEAFPSECGQRIKSNPRGPQLVGFGSVSVKEDDENDPEFLTTCRRNDAQTFDNLKSRETLPCTTTSEKRGKSPLESSPLASRMSSTYEDVSEERPTLEDGDAFAAEGCTSARVCSAVSAKLTAVYVDPDHTRRRVGRSLVSALEDSVCLKAASHCSKRHCVCMRVDSSLNATAFYGSCGYGYVKDASHQPDGASTALACRAMRKSLYI